MSRAFVDPHVIEQSLVQHLTTSSPAFPGRHSQAEPIPVGVGFGGDPGLDLGLTTTLTALLLPPPPVDTVLPTVPPPIGALKHSSPLNWLLPLCPCGNPHIPTVIPGGT
jgi:hypothetical protein